MPDGSIARIENLRVEFQTKSGTVAGVEDVSFQINPGETVCVVGESGSGKSVSSLSLMRLIDFGGGDIAKGRLLFDRAGGGEIDLAETDQDLMRTIRGNEIGMIFQEPMTALNPVFTVERQLTEGLRLHKGMSKAQAYRYIVLPQSVKFMLPPMTGEVVHLIKSSAIVSVIAVVELTTIGRNLISDTYMSFEIWFTIAAVYVVVTLALSIGVSRLEKKYAVQT